jgi:hypothetical protein
MELLRLKIKEMESGINRNNGRKFSIATIMQWKNFMRLLQRYEQMHEKINFQKIDSVFWDHFKQFCEEEGLMPKSTNKYLAVFRALITYAQAKGLIINHQALQTYKKVPIYDDDTKAKTYLNEHELQALYDMKLSGLKDRVRDIFMLGCYPGQRVSDEDRHGCLNQHVADGVQDGVTETDPHLAVVHNKLICLQGEVHRPQENLTGFQRSGAGEGGGNNVQDGVCNHQDQQYQNGSGNPV